MIHPIVRIVIGAFLLGCFNLPAFEKQNLTIRGSFDNSRLAFETKKKGTVAFMGGIDYGNERVSSYVNGFF